MFNGMVIKLTGEVRVLPLGEAPKDKTIIFPIITEPHEISLDTKDTIISLIKQDTRLGLEVILKDPAFSHMIGDLINVKNKNELSSLIINKFLEGYYSGLMRCYDLLKQYDKLQVYEAIDNFDRDESYKEVLKSCLMT